MNSCIYEGLVRHRRNTPSHHQFDFRSFMLLLDLDELDTVFKNRLLWSTKRFSFARFNEDQHLIAYRDAGPIRARVESVLAESDFRRPIGSVRLLTQLSFFGFTMNPVSFYYCFDPTETFVEAVVAEVNNTPWGEQHVYVLPADDPDEKRSPKASVFADLVDKVFHVSPFMSCQMKYRMAFSALGKSLGVKIENHLDEPLNGVSKILDVSMSLNQKPITSWNLSRLLLRYPLVSFQIFGGIYWQALRLYLKKIPFQSHPGNVSVVREAKKAESKLNHPTNPSVKTTLFEPKSDSSTKTDSENALVSQ